MRWTWVHKRFQRSSLNVAMYELRYKTETDPLVRVRNKMVRKRPSYRERKDYVLAHRGQYKTVYNLFFETDDVNRTVRRRLGTARILAVVIETIAAVPDSAKKFWKPVLTGVGTRPVHASAHARLLEELPVTLKNHDWRRLYGLVLAWNTWAGGHTRATKAAPENIGSLQIGKTALIIR